MNETELESLIVRLTGDGSSYQKMLQEAQDASRRVAKEVERSTNTIQGLGDGLRNFGGSALGLLGMLGVVGSLNEAFQRFVRHEEGIIKMNATIEASGRTVADVVPEYLKFAEALERTTLLSKGAVMGLLQQAETYGLQDEAAKRAIRTSIGLAQGNEDEARSYMSIAAAMERGNYQLLRRVPGLRGIRDESELLRKAQERINTGLKVAEELTKTTGGSLYKLGRSFKSLSTDVGEVVATALKPFIDLVREGIDWFKSLDPVVKKVNVGILAFGLGLKALPTALAFLAPIGTVLTAPLRLTVGLLSSIPSLWSVIASAISGAGAVLSGFAGTLLKLVPLALSILNPLRLIPLILSGIGLLLSPLTLGLTAAIGGLGFFISEMGGVKKAWKAVTDAAASAWSIVKTKTLEFVAWVRPVWSALKELGGAVWDGVKSAAAAVWPVVRDAFNTVKDFVLDSWRAISGESGETWQGIRSTVVRTLKSATALVRSFSATVAEVWEYLRDTAEPVWEGVVTVFRKVRDFLGGVWDGIVEIASTVWEEVGDTISGALEFASAALDSFSAFAVGVWESLREVAAPLWEGVVSIVSDVVDFVRDTWDTVVNATEGAWATVREVVLGTVAGLGVVLGVLAAAVVGAGHLLVAAWEALADIAEPLWSSVVRVFTDVQSFIQNVWDAVVNSTEGAWASVRQAVLGFVGGVVLALAGVVAAAQVAWQGLLAGWELLKGAVGGVIDTVVQLASVTASWVGAGLSQTEELVGTLGAVAGAVVAVIAAYRLLVFTVSLVNGVLAFLKVQQIVQLGLWVAWKAVVLAAQSVMLLFNAQMAVYMGLVGLATGASTAWSIATTAAQVATWLWNAALSVTNALLAGAALVAGAAVIGAIATALIVVGSAAWAAYKALEGLAGVFAGVWDAGPLRYVTGLLREWWELLKDVFSAMSVDGALAWQLLQQGASLAVEQVKALWPPLWDYIRSGFSAAWEFVSSEFTNRFMQALSNARSHLNAYLNVVGQAVQYSLTGTGTFDTRTLDQELANTSAQANANSEAFARQARERLAAAASAFGVTETDAMARLRRDIEQTRRDIANAASRQRANESPLTQQEVDPLAGLRNREAEALALGAGVGQAFSRGVEHNLPRFDAVQRHSAEALARINEHLERIRTPRQQTQQERAAQAVAARQVEQQRREAVVANAVQAGGAILAQLAAPALPVLNGAALAAGLNAAAPGIAAGIAAQFGPQFRQIADRLRPAPPPRPPGPSAVEATARAVAQSLPVQLLAQMFRDARFGEPVIPGFGVLPPGWVRPPEPAAAAPAPPPGGVVTVPGLGNIPATWLRPPTVEIPPAIAAAVNRTREAQLLQQGFDRTIRALATIADRNAFMASVLAMGARPGSIYVHDTGARELLALLLFEAKNLEPGSVEVLETTDAVDEVEQHAQESLDELDRLPDMIQRSLDSAATQRVTGPTGATASIVSASQTAVAALLQGTMAAQTAASSEAFAKAAERMVGEQLGLKTNVQDLQSRLSLPDVLLKESEGEASTVRLDLDLRIAPLEVARIDLPQLPELTIATEVKSSLVQIPTVPASTVVDVVDVTVEASKSLPPATVQALIEVKIPTSPTVETPEALANPFLTGPSISQLLTTNSYTNTTTTLQPQRSTTFARQIEIPTALPVIAEVTSKAAPVVARTETVKTEVEALPPWPTVPVLPATAVPSPFLAGPRISELLTRQTITTTTDTTLQLQRAVTPARLVELPTSKAAPVLLISQVAEKLTEIAPRTSAQTAANPFLAGPRISELLAGRGAVPFSGELQTQRAVTFSRQLELITLPRSAGSTTEKALQTATAVSGEVDKLPPAPVTPWPGVTLNEQPPISRPGSLLDTVATKATNVVLEIRKAAPTVTIPAPNVTIPAPNVTIPAPNAAIALPRGTTSTVTLTPSLPTVTPPVLQLRPSAVAPVVLHDHSSLLFLENAANVAERTAQRTAVIRVDENLVRTGESARLLAGTPTTNALVTGMVPSVNANPFPTGPRINGLPRGARVPFSTDLMPYRLVTYRDLVTLPTVTEKAQDSVVRVQVEVDKSAPPEPPSPFLTMSARTQELPATKSVANLVAAVDVLVDMVPHGQPQQIEVSPFLRGARIADLLTLGGTTDTLGRLVTQRSVTFSRQTEVRTLTEVLTKTQPPLVAETQTDLKSLGPVSVAMDQLLGTAYSLEPIVDMTKEVSPSLFIPGDLQGVIEGLVMPYKPLDVLVEVRVSQEPPLVIEKSAPAKETDDDRLADLVSTSNKYLSTIAAKEPVVIEAANFS